MENKLAYKARENTILETVLAGVVPHRVPFVEFEISHWHMETVHKFKGGKGQDLTFSYSWADHFDKKESIYKYENKEWIKINDGSFN